MCFISALKVNCGGITTRGGILDSKVDQLDHMYRLHVRAVYLLSQLVTPHLMKTKGSSKQSKVLTSICTKFLNTFYKDKLHVPENKLSAIVNILIIIINEKYFSKNIYSRPYIYLH